MPYAVWISNESISSCARKVFSNETRSTCSISIKMIPMSHVLFTTNIQKPLFEKKNVWMSPMFANAKCECNLLSAQLKSMNEFHLMDFHEEKKKHRK